MCWCVPYILCSHDIWTDRQPTLKHNASHHRYRWGRNVEEIEMLQTISTQNVFEKKLPSIWEWGLGPAIAKTPILQAVAYLSIHVKCPLNTQLFHHTLRFTAQSIMRYWLRLPLSSITWLILSRWAGSSRWWNGPPGANANDQLWKEWQGGLIFSRKSLEGDLAGGHLYSRRAGLTKCCQN